MYTNLALQIIWASILAAANSTVSIIVIISIIIIIIDTNEDETVLEPRTKLQVEDEKKRNYQKTS